MPRLRRADCSAPGIRRMCRGRGFSYVDECTEETIADKDTIERVRELAIPPAWEDVWICPHPNGHIQAVGTDARGRKQYRYHDRWRERRDQEKFDEMLEFAKALPGLRETTARQLRRRSPNRERVLAGAVRLLDRGFFRIGGEEYAEENDTYGIATMEKRHVRLRPGYLLEFDYVSKGGQRRLQSVVDPEVYRLVGELKRRRGGGDGLLAYKERGRWRDVRSTDVNDYIKEVTGGDFSAKDFRTWSATVLAAVAVAVSGRAAGSPRSTSPSVSSAPSIVTPASKRSKTRGSM
jgi:DNA topoisomerase-1